MSLHVSELEARLNAKLLVRGSRRVVPTAVGFTLVEHARRLLRDADDVVEAIKRQVEGHVGRVRLGASTGVAIHLLPQVLEKMARDYPDIDVAISILGSSEMMLQLSQGTLDIGLVATPQPPAPDVAVTAQRPDDGVRAEGLAGARLRDAAVVVDPRFDFKRPGDAYASADNGMVWRRRLCAAAPD